MTRPSFGDPGHAAPRGRQAPDFETAAQGLRTAMERYRNAVAGRSRSERDAARRAFLEARDIYDRAANLAPIP